MANEITISGSLSFTKNAAHGALSGSLHANMTGDHYQEGVQDIGTAEEQISKGDIGTIGWVAFRNMDSVNYVEIGAVTAEYSIKLGPGEFHGPMRWNGAGVFAKANTAACKVEYLLIEL